METEIRASFICGAQLSPPSVDTRNSHERRCKRLLLQHTRTHVVETLSRSERLLQWRFICFLRISENLLQAIHLLLFLEFSTFEIFDRNDCATLLSSQ